MEFLDEVIFLRQIFFIEKRVMAFGCYGKGLLFRILGKYRIRGTNYIRSILFYRKLY